MNCPKCGAPLEEDSNFCTSCGANLEFNNGMEKTSFQDYSTKEACIKEEIPNKSKKRVNIIGLFAGTILIIIGLIRIYSSGTSISSTSFGGDFYTYTYRGIVAISEILASIEVTLGWVVVAIGVAIDVGSLKK